MKKRKKKPSQVQRQKLEAAHFKNEFFIRLKNLCKIMGVAEVYNMIPSGDLENIFALRFQAPRVMAAAGFQVPNAVLNDVSHIFTEIFKNYLVPISKDGIEISFYDYLTIFMTLIFYGSALENHPHAKSDAIIKSLKHFDDYLMAEEINKSKLLQRSMMYISELESDIRSAVYWLRIESMVDEYKGKTGAYSFIYIYSHTPEKKSFVIDHVSRPALRVGWGVSVMHKTYDYIKIPAEKVRSDYNIKNLTFDVYIQSHALQRLDERLDGLRPGLMHSQLYFSLLTNPGIQWDKGGNLLLDMKLWDIKEYSTPQAIRHI
ncbi:MAG: hypothetical protein WCL06_07860, partial [Bacteroidota bacterium]